MSEEDPLAFLRGDVRSEDACEHSLAHSSGIVATLEVDEGRRPTIESQHLIAKALELNAALGTRVTGWLVAEEPGEAAKSFVHYGLDKVVVENGKEGIDIAGAVSAMSKWAEAFRPELWMFGESKLSKELAARLAARLGTGLVSGVFDIHLNIEERCAEFTHWEFEGKMKRTYAIKDKRPQMAVLRREYGYPARLDETITTPIEAAGV